MHNTMKGCAITRRGLSCSFLQLSRLRGNREKDLQRQVQTSRDQLKDMHNSNESTQAKLMDASQRQGESGLRKA